IVLLPEVWQANGPATLNMLYLIGLGLHSDVSAKLLHLSYGILLGLATFAAGKRYVGPNGGWLAVAILLGMPILPFWASWAYTDMAWALYEFLALYVFILWVENRTEGSSDQSLDDSQRGSFKSVLRNSLTGAGARLSLCGLMVGLSL